MENDPYPELDRSGGNPRMQHPSGGESVAQFIVSYDLKASGIGPHFEVIKQGYSNGWSQWIRIDGCREYKLPNTTLVGDFLDIATAESAFVGTIASAERALGARITVEKQIIMQASRTISVTDEVR